MNWKVRFGIGGVSMAMLLATPQLPAEATIATATMAISATVTTYCSITASPLAFGSYTGSALAVNTSVVVNCTNSLAYTVGLDQGVNGASVTARKMISAGNLLAYGLYTNVGLTTNWGNTTGTWVSGTGTGANQTLTVYGSLPAGQNVPTGSYTDTVTATVTY